MSSPKKLFFQVYVICLQVILQVNLRLLRVQTLQNRTKINIRFPCCKHTKYIFNSFYLIVCNLCQKRSVYDLDFNILKLYSQKIEPKIIITCFISLYYLYSYMYRFVIIICISCRKYLRIISKAYECQYSCQLCYFLSTYLIGNYCVLFLFESLKVSKLTVH